MTMYFLKISFILVSTKWVFFLSGKSYVNQLNTAGLTPLYIAATDGFSVITEKLLAAGANRDDQCTSDGYTPLISAVLNERTPVIRDIAQGRCLIDLIID